MPICHLVNRTTSGGYLGGTGTHNLNQRVDAEADPLIIELQSGVENGNSGWVYLCKFRIIRPYKDLLPSRSPFKMVKVAANFRVGQEAVESLALESESSAICAWQRPDRCGQWQTNL